jgi:hypothetical protein
LALDTARQLDFNFRNVITDSPSRRLCEEEAGWLGRYS